MSRRLHSSKSFGVFFFQTEAQFQVIWFSELIEFWVLVLSIEYWDLRIKHWRRTCGVDETYFAGHTEKSFQFTFRLSIDSWIGFWIPISGQMVSFFSYICSAVWSPMKKDISTLRLLDYNECQLDMNVILAFLYFLILHWSSSTKRNIELFSTWLGTAHCSHRK